MSTAQKKNPQQAAHGTDERSPGEKVCEEPSRQALETEARLELFRQGIRILTRQTKRTHQHGRQQHEHDKNASNEAYDEDAEEQAMPGHLFASIAGNMTCHDDPSLKQLMANHYNDDVAYDLLNLQDAIRMMQDHFMLASEEASRAQMTEVDGQSWKQRALEAEALNQDYLAENANLRAQVHQLASERKLLVKECRLARKKVVQAETKCQHHQMERYALEALTAHEKQLAKKNSAITPSASDHYSLDDTNCYLHKLPLDLGASYGVHEEKKTDIELKMFHDSLHAQPLSMSRHPNIQRGHGSSFDSIDCSHKDAIPTEASSGDMSLETKPNVYQPLRLSPIASLDSCLKKGPQNRNRPSWKRHTNHSRGVPLLLINATF